MQTRSDAPLAPSSGDPVDTGVFHEDEPAPTSDETRQEFLAWSKSGYSKVRHSFIQAPPSALLNSQPAMLAHFGRNHRAAVLYLAVLANWPWLSREREPLSADIWIRFLTCDGSAALTWTPQSLSHAWSVLEGLNLIDRPRKGRLKQVNPKKEDGGGAAYTSPTGASGDHYLTLPHEFWTRQLHGTLSWPALAVMLILLKETGDRSVSALAVDRAQAWYGISRTTTEEGLAELRKLNLVASKDRYVKAFTATGGRRLTSEHSLLGDFSTARREELRIAAKRRVDQKQSSPASPRGSGVKQSGSQAIEGDTSK